MNSQNFSVGGEDMQILEIDLEPGKAVRAEIGTVVYIEDGINMQTSSGGGFVEGLKRMFTGESFFISSFQNVSDKSKKVAFAASYPGKIVPIEMKQHNQQVLCQKDSFLCSDEEIEIEIAFTKKFGAGIFGGEGFILQKLMGEGMAFIHCGGTIIEKDLKANETLRVDTGCLVAFDVSIQYDIKFVGGFKNVLFGGEGMFFASLTGPGKVYLQSLPFSRIADRIVEAAKKRGVQEESKGVGGILGQVISGR